MQTELVVSPLEEVDEGALAAAKRNGRVRLGLEYPEGRVALYVATEAVNVRRVGYVRSGRVLTHLRDGKQGFARLNESISGAPSIICTLLY